MGWVWRFRRCLGLPKTNEAMRQKEGVQKSRLPQSANPAFLFKYWQLSNNFFPCVCLIFFSKLPVGLSVFFPVWSFVVIFSRNQENHLRHDDWRGDGNRFSDAFRLSRANSELKWNIEKWFPGFSECRGLRKTDVSHVFFYLLHTKQIHLCLAFVSARAFKECIFFTV